MPQRYRLISSKLQQFITNCGVVVSMPVVEVVVIVRLKGKVAPMLN
jgi:hypothetical protein